LPACTAHSYHQFTSRTAHVHRLFACLWLELCSNEMAAWHFNISHSHIGDGRWTVSKAAQQTVLDSCTVITCQPQRWLLVQCTAWTRRQQYMHQFNPLKPSVIIRLQFEYLAPQMPNLPFLISNIPALSHSVLSARVSEIKNGRLGFCGKV